MTSTYTPDDSATTDRFDFDEWMQLAEGDPAAFEAARQQALEAAIAEAPPASRRRLQGLLWQMNIHRQQTQNPMAACLKSYQQMWDKVYGPGGLQDILTNGLSSDSSRIPAKVLKFKQHKE